MQIVINVETIEDLNNVKALFSAIKQRLNELTEKFNVGNSTNDCEVWQALQSSHQIVDNIIKQTNIF